MSAGSWLRFVIGILLSIEAVRLWFAGSGSLISIGLAALYIVLAAAFAVFKF